MKNRKKKQILRVALITMLLIPTFGDWLTTLSSWPQATLLWRAWPWFWPWMPLPPLALCSSASRVFPLRLCSATNSAKVGIVNTRWWAWRARWAGPLRSRWAMTSSSGESSPDDVSITSWCSGGKYLDAGKFQRSLVVRRQNESEHFKDYTMTLCHL